jgi:hypothetical protein
MDPKNSNEMSKVSDVSKNSDVPDKRVSLIDEEEIIISSRKTCNNSNVNNSNVNNSNVNNSTNETTNECDVKPGVKHDIQRDEINRSQEKIRGAAFPVIIKFINSLWEIFGTKKKVTPLALYYRLLEHIKSTDVVSIDKIILGFREFFINNPQVISENNLFVIPRGTNISYSKTIYIEIQKYIFKSRDDKNTLDAILQHLSTIDAIINPSKQKMEQLEKSYLDDSEESKFIGNILTKTQSSLGDNIDVNNPMGAIAGLLQSGVFTDLYKGIETGMRTNTLNPQKLFSTMSTALNSMMGGKSADFQETFSMLMNPKKSE